MMKAAMGGVMCKLFITARTTNAKAPHQGTKHRSLEKRYYHDNNIITPLLLLRYYYYRKEEEKSAMLTDSRQTGKK